MNPGPLLRGRFGFAITVALVTAFWFPALFRGRVLIHGDSAVYGLPFVRLLSRALHGDGSLLWCRVTGGHPLFAEGQGGFANPLHILTAYLFDPVRAIGVLHWLGVSAGAAGVFCLCRVLGIRSWAAVFASIALAFSGTWIVNQHNLPISATVAFAPWLIAAAEYWLAKPTLGRATLLSMPVPLMVFAGYPQITHGTLLYVVVAFCTRAAASECRRSLVANARALALTGCAAVALASGLAAIQLLPLAELVGLSHRSDGTSLTYGGFMRPEWIEKGLLYFHINKNDSGANIPSMGSIVVMSLFGLVIFLRAPARVLAHAVAGLVLFNLGIGRVSPLFRLVYDNHLLPGLHSFRIIQPNLAVGVIGIGVVAAYMLDRLSCQPLPLWPWFEKRKALAAIGCVSFGLAMIVACQRWYEPAFSLLAFAAPLSIVACCAALSLKNRRQWLPLGVVVIVSLDAIVLRMNPFTFVERQAIELPAMAEDVLADPELPSYQVMSTTGADAMTFMPARDPGLREAYRRVLNSLGRFPGLEWNVATIDAPLALPLQRWKTLYPYLMAEVAGEDHRPPRLRLMDILGIRYVSANKPLTTRGLVLSAQDGKNGMRIYKNHAAKPIVQLYGQAVVATSADDANLALHLVQRPTVVLERAFSGARPELTPATACTAEQLASIQPPVINASARQYRIQVDLPCDAWLFVADANYPGWEATVNGIERPVFTAQVLGKAVQLRTGTNDVSIRFAPRTFYWGAAITGLALMALLCLAVRSLRVRAKHRKLDSLPAPTQHGPKAEAGAE
jgi:hypothetical protein